MLNKMIRNTRIQEYKNIIRMFDYAMIYHDSHCTTLQEGLRILHSISNPILSYRQTISLTNISCDMKYLPYIKHDVMNEIITLSFPTEYAWIANFRNTHHCKMVTYYKDMVHSYITEITITPSINIKIRPDTTIHIYTKGKKDIDISFDVFLMKSDKKRVMAKL